METRKGKRNQKKGNKKGLKIVLIVLGVLLLAGIIYFAYLYKQVDNASLRDVSTTRFRPRKERRN